MPVPLVAVNPLGSLIYQTPYSSFGTIAPAEDVDDWTIDVNAGQTITLRLGAYYSLVGSIELIGPDGISLGIAQGTYAGEGVVLQTVQATLTGTYTILVSGAYDTTGGYLLDLTLNAAIETEGNGSTNNDLASAQSLAGSFIPVTSESDRGAVIGTLDGPGGYQASALPFEFIDISTTGTPILQGVDDGDVYLDPAELDGFQFTFSGFTSDSFYVSSNGYIYLNSPDGYGYLYVLGADLVVYGSPDASVYWQVVGSGDEQQLIIQWNEVGYYGYFGGDPVTFEAVLNEADGSVQYNYLDLQTDNYRNEGYATTVGAYGYSYVDGTSTSLFLDTYNVPNQYVGTGRSTLLSAQPPTADYYAFDLGTNQSRDDRTRNGGHQRPGPPDSGRPGQRAGRGGRRLRQPGGRDQQFRRPHRRHVLRGDRWRKLRTV